MFGSPAFAGFAWQLPPWVYDRNGLEPRCRDVLLQKTPTPAPAAVICRTPMASVTFGYTTPLRRRASKVEVDGLEPRAIRDEVG